MNNDQLTECKRCGGNACYEQVIDESTKTWLCMGCGFTTSTLLYEGSKAVNTALETAPELYKAVNYKDGDNLVWMPSTITLPGQGMVFLDGTTKTDWKWAAVKAVVITEEEKSKFPPNQTHRMDMKNIKHFEQKDFMEALGVIGFFEIV